MKQTIVPFDLPAWRQRMQFTQATAAGALGLSLSGYTRAEYRCQDAPGKPVNATVAKLAQLLEMHHANHTAD